MVQTDTSTRLLRFIGVGFIVMGLVGVGLLFTNMLLFAINLLTPGGPVQLFAPLLLAAFGVVFISLSQRFQRLEARRQLAVQRAQQSVPMAAEQPLPNATVCPLPYMLRLGPRWSAVFVAFLLILLASTGLTILSIGKLDLFTLLITLLLSGVGAALISTLLVKASYNQIVVTETGLRVVRYRGTQHFVQWETAQLFAVLPVGPASRKSHLPLAYELSSATEIVRWVRMRRHTPFSLLLFYKPLNPFEEYNRQMDSLLTYIAAKTGLPLYDLR